MDVTIPSLDEIRQVVREEIARALGERGAGQPFAGLLLTTEQAALEAGVKAKTIRTWVAEGLPVKRRGRRILIERKALDAWRTGEAPQVTDIIASLTKAA